LNRPGFNIQRRAKSQKEKQLNGDMVHGGDRGMVEGNASDDEVEEGKVQRQGEIVYIERD